MKSAMFAASFATAAAGATQSIVEVAELCGEECDALCKLKTGIDSKLTGNWCTGIGGVLTDSSPCAWSGVTCTGGFVTRLDLQKQDLNALDPILQLQRLEYLNLYKSNFKGGIPENIGQLTALKYLNFYDVHLDGSIPQSIGQLSNLEYLNLNCASLTGSIPETIGGLTALKYLNFYDVHLDGSIPQSIGQLSNLEYLNLNKASLTGSIPETIGGLSNLQDLNLYKAGLTGSIPETLCSLPGCFMGFNETTCNIDGNPFVRPCPSCFSQCPFPDKVVV